MESPGTSRRKKAAEWAAAYKQWQTSGLRQRSYCKKTGLNFTQFKSGVQDAMQRGVLERPKRKDQGSGRQSKAGPAGFAPVQINNPPYPARYCEIWFEGKLGVRIETSESLRYFVELLNGRREA